MLFLLAKEGLAAGCVRVEDNFGKDWIPVTGDVLLETWIGGL